MSTICKIGLIAAADDVIAATQEFLRQSGCEVAVTNTEWPTAWERENFRSSFDFTTRFSIRQVTSDVTEIHFNSFPTALSAAPSRPATAS